MTGNDSDELCSDPPRAVQACLDGETWDYVVIGSGFGGSISALRLVQKGYRVAVLEAGRRFAPDDFPKTNWDSKNYTWLPRLGWTGGLRMTFLRHAVVLGGAGVGGGSLFYGNTLFRPMDSFFESPEARRLGSREQLLRFYQLAERMLGVTANPRQFAPDRWIREVAAEYGREHTFTPSPVAVNFDVEGADPYFADEGPARSACNFCGGCFLGCRYDAKNTLDRNYLWFAEKLGAVVFPETEAIAIQPVADGRDGYRIVTRSGTSASAQWFGGKKTIVRARHVVLAAGVIGTLRLLLGMKRSAMPRISDRVGHDVKTNSETLPAVSLRDRSADISEGIAASSSVFPDDVTQIQIDRYPKGADALALTMTLMVDGGGRLPRALRFVGEIARHPVRFLRMFDPRGWAQRSMVLVVMQNLDSSLRVVLEGNRLASLPGEGEMVPAYIPIGNDFARRLARRCDGDPLNNWNEVVANIPATAHVLGGCRMGESPSHSVIDARNRLHGYDGVLVCDGSVITSNLGANPALSIAAFTERAMSFVPPKPGHTFTPLPFENAWPEARVLLESANDTVDRASGRAGMEASA